MPITTFFPSGSGGGGAGQDRFAPKYLVGGPNDTAAALAGIGGFWFFPDTGDGAGIAAALAQAAILAGDVWIRPGTFTLGAAVPTPLVVPANVQVRGSGKSTTVIVGKTAGDQGVFLVNSGGGLRDLSVTNTGSVSGVGSTAMIHCMGDGITLDHVGVSFTTADGNALREGVRFEGVQSFPVSEVLDLTINASSLTTDTPTRCLMLAAGQNIALVSTRLLQTFGGNEGVFVEDGSLLAKDTLCFNWRDYGLRSGAINGSIRFDEGAFFSDGAATAIGISLQGNAHVLRSLVIQGTSLGFRGIEMIQPGTQMNIVQIDDCLVQGFSEGIIGGDTVSAVIAGCTITDTSVQAGSVGIRFANGVGGGESASCHISGCEVSIAPGGTVGIHLLNGRNHHITDCEVSVSENTPTPGVHGILISTSDPSLQSKLHTITANGVNVNNGGYGINVEGERNTITGNIVQANDSEGCLRSADSSGQQSGVRNTITGNDFTFNGATPTSLITGLPTAMVVESTRAAVTGNTTYKGNGGGSWGLTLTVASGFCVVTGNLVDNGFGPAVLDLAGTSSLVNNIGV